MIKSYYDLSLQKAKELEAQFRKLEQGHLAYQVWIFNNIVGILIAIISTFFFFYFSFFSSDSFSLILFFGILLVFGCLIVYSSTLEYYKKYNSWLRVSKKIVRD